MEAQRFPDDYDGIISACSCDQLAPFRSCQPLARVVMLSMSNFVSKAKLDAADGRP